MKQWFARHIDTTLYIQLWAHQLRLVNVVSGAEFNEAPFIALEQNRSGRPRVKAIGNDAQALINTAGLEVVNPFAHPRMLIANFAKAEKVLAYAVKHICRGRLFTVSPRVVCQPMEKLEGGITDVEARAFRELCLGAGAREVVLYQGAPLVLAQFDYAHLKQQDI